MAGNWKTHPIEISDNWLDWIYPIGLEKSSFFVEVNLWLKKQRQRRFPHEAKVNTDLMPGKMLADGQYITVANFQGTRERNLELVGNIKEPANPKGGYTLSSFHYDPVNQTTKSQLFQGSERAVIKELARLQNHYAGHTEEDINPTDKTVGQYLVGV